MHVKRDMKKIVKFLVLDCKCDPTIADMKRGVTGLHLAALNNHLSIVKFLCSLPNVSPDVKDKGKRSPLHLAAANNNSDIIHYLVSEHKCNMSAKDSSGITPANLVTLKSDVLDNLQDNMDSYDLTTTLLQGGNWLESTLRNNPQNFTVRRLAVSGDCAALKSLIESSKDRSSLLKSKGPNGETILHNAAFAGNLEVVKYLVKECKCDLNLKDFDGHTPLHNSAHNGHIGVVRFLCSCEGIMLSQHDKHGRTPLHYAAQNDHLKVVQCLVGDYNCGDVMHEDKNHVTPFQLSADAGNFDIFKYLVAHSSCNPHHKDKNGRTALHGASQNGHPEIAKYLVNHCKCDPMETDSAHGVNSVHLAASGGSLELIKFYSSLNGCDFNSKSRDGGRVPLHQASQHGHYDIISFLLEKYRGKISVMQGDENGVTPFHLAAYNGHVNILHLFMKQPNVNPDQKDRNGRTAVHCASQEGQLDVIKLLVNDLSCSVASKDKNNVTPANLAAANGHVEVLRILACKDAKTVHFKDKHHRTPLHYACQNGHLEVVKVLVEEFNCNMNERDKLVTPRQLAGIVGHRDIVEYFDRVSGGKRASFYDNCSNNNLHLCYTFDYQDSNQMPNSDLHDMLQNIARYVNSSSTRIGKSFIIVIKSIWVHLSY